MVAAFRLVSGEQLLSKVSLGQWFFCVKLFWESEREIDLCTRLWQGNLFWRVEQVIQMKTQGGIPDWVSLSSNHKCTIWWCRWLSNVITHQDFQHPDSYLLNTSNALVPLLAPKVKRKCEFIALLKASKRCSMAPIAVGILLLVTEIGPSVNFYVRFI